MTDKIILFDWDNTLVDSRHALRESMNAVLDAGFTLPDKPLRQKFFGRSFRDGFPHLFGKNWQQAQEIYNEKFIDIRGETFAPIVDAERMLKKLRHAGYHLAIASNRIKDLLEDEVEKMGWRDLFFAVCGSESTDADKPNPKHAHYILAKGGFDINQHIANQTLLMIGDSVVDVLFGHHVGIRSILLRHEGEPIDDSAIRQCDYQEIAALAELDDYI